MTQPIGFVILSHADPDQLGRLVATLNHLYRHPPISIHHDFHQSRVDAGRFSANVSFVLPSLHTQWAHISVVQAALAALRQLYSRAKPDWFTLLSGADYPVMSGAEVLAELSRAPFDLYLDYQKIEPRPLPLPGPAVSRMGTDSIDWRRRMYDRFVAREWRYPSLTRRLKYTYRSIIFRSVLLRGPFVPFRSNRKCYAGDHWFTGNARVAELLLEAETGQRDLFDYFASRFCPEEAIYHTILGNHPGLRICKDNRRYTHWSGLDAHPRTITLDDLPVARRQRCHFARKFSSSASQEVLAEIDRFLALVPPSS
jgi:hypothetical protein